MPRSGNAAVASSPVVCSRCGGTLRARRARCPTCFSTCRSCNSAVVQADISDRDMQSELLQMGFGRRRVQQALRSVGSRVEAALSWLLDGVVADGDTQAGEEELALPKSRCPYTPRPRENSVAHATPPSSPNGAHAHTRTHTHTRASLITHLLQF